MSIITEDCTTSSDDVTLRTICARGGNSAAAERSALLQPKRSQPSADTKQPHSMRSFIPADLVQNTAEYLGRVAGLLSFRGVSTEWQGAVSDAVGFLNGRCWNRLEFNDRSLPIGIDELWARLRLDDAAAVARCAVLCLRQRLETITCGLFWSQVCFPLRLLGETNDALVTLGLHEYTHSLDELSCLLGCVALRELSLRGTQITNESFAGLEQLLARLHKLDLSGCKQLTAISNLAPATSLRELNLAYSSVEDLGGLDKLVALETLDVIDISTEDLSILRQCPRLVTLTAQGNIITLECIIHAAAPSLIDCRLHLDRPVSARVLNLPDLRSLSCLRRSTVLRFRDLDNASLQGLEEIPSLQILDLEVTHVDDVRSLAGCRALRELRLAESLVTDVGIIGLERIATLEVLDLTGSQITSVTGLCHCTALRELILDGTSVTDASIAGLECIVTLTALSLVNCNLITSVASLRDSPSLQLLDISHTELTAAGSMGLDEIGTLQCLVAAGRTQLDASTLRRCRSLRTVGLNGSGVTDTVLAALADVRTLETLLLSRCREVHDVSALARSISLRVLDLSCSAVSDTGIAGLERIPSLTCLSLASCDSITNVTNLFRSKSLRRLVLSETFVTDAGLVGLGMAPALELIGLRDCAHVNDVATVVQRAAERSVKVDCCADPG
jgi:Leucine-rich repeat (LRR) protein